MKKTENDLFADFSQWATDLLYYKKWIRLLLLKESIFWRYFCLKCRLFYCFFLFHFEKFKKFQINIPVRQDSCWNNRCDSCTLSTNLSYFICWHFMWFTWPEIQQALPYLCCLLIPKMVHDTFKINHIQIAENITFYFHWVRLNEKIAQ
jgi:hypothetical protein